MPVLSFTQALTKATAELMHSDSKVHVMGLGATYPNGLDGTMGDLAQIYPDRVHDMPCSENVITGSAVGMAAMGLHPIVHHGRIEFALYAMDAILTQAAKWNYMFGGDYPVPLALRIAMGRQWGNGPQHTLNRKNLFSHPGLTVACPSSPQQAYDLMHCAVLSQNPFILLENRWLYKLKGEVDEKPLPSGNYAKVLRAGTDLTIVAVGDMVLEALRAATYLRNHASIEVIDPVWIYPLDSYTLRKSAHKTGKVLVVESDTLGGSFAAEIMGHVSCDAMTGFLTCGEHPCPTAPSQTANYYPTDKDIVDVIATLLNLRVPAMPAKTFEQLNLPPTDNISELITTF